MREFLLWFFLAVLIFLRILFFYRNQVSYPDGTKIRITSRVSSEPIYFADSQYLRLLGYRIYLPLYPQINYGDVVTIEGVVDTSKLRQARLVQVKEMQGSIYFVRKKISEFFNKNLPQPHSSLVAGVTLGSKSDIPEDFWKSLKNSGTAHVVVASGMNVTLVSGFLIQVLTLFLSRKKAIPLALVGVWFYSLTSGFDAPIIRAAIMGSIAFIAQEAGRLNSSIRTLLISASLMLFFKPDWIADLGFLLSFSATLGLILMESKVYRFIYFVPENFRLIKKDFSTSVAASLGVFPILLYSFGRVNIFSPFINAIVLWTIPLITIIGMSAGIIGLFVPTLGRGILLLSYPLSSWFIFVIKLFG